MSIDNRWARAALGDERAFALLAEELPPSTLWSLLLEVAERRAARRRPADLVSQWERDPFVRPGAVDQRAAVRADALVLDAASAFEAIELSPVAPLGVCSVMAKTTQNRVLSALRGTELVADPTNVLALECASRLRRAPRDTVRLATCMRVMRAQAIPKLPGFSQHFRIFVLATAAREEKDHAAVVAGMAEHIRTQIACLDALERGAGAHFPDRVITLFATTERAGIADRIATAINGAAPRIDRALLEHPYYSGGLRYQINARTVDGDPVPLIDGGTFDWVATLTSNRRALFVASGMGIQLVHLRFCPR